MKKTLTILFPLIIQMAHAQTVLSGMPVPDNDVWAIFRTGNTVYIGGEFTNVNGVPRSHIASFDAVTGVLSAWNPAVDGAVLSIGMAGGKLIAGGSFSNVNSQPRQGVCIFDLPSGSLNSWSPPHPAYTTKGLGFYNNYFYYSGFVPSGFQRLYCVDASTVTNTLWQSDSTADDARAILRSGNYIYSGGSSLRRYDVTTGTMDASWSPALSISDFINGIIDIDSKIYIGGSYSSIAGQARNGLASFDPGGGITSFNIASSSVQIWSLFPAGDYIWGGGNSHTYGTNTRYRMAEIDIAAQNSTCWDPTPYSSGWSFVNAIFVSGDTVYAGPGYPTSSSDYLKVFINSPRPHPGPISGPVVVNAFQMAAYSIPNTPGHTYYWSVTNGTGSSTTNSINITWGTGPNGVVSVVENNPLFSDCHSDTITLPVNILGTGINEEISENNFSVYPNPSGKKSVVKFFNSEATPVSVFLRDITGREIPVKCARAVPGINLIEIDLGNYCKGAYTIILKSNNGYRQQRLIVE